MKTGPFGLQIGLSFEDINLDLSPVEGNPFRFTTKNVPKNHSAFDLYALDIAPISGLFAITAFGKTIITSRYGIEIKTAFESLKSKLDTAYGKSELTDVLLPNSIWNEPQDWMSALEKKERILVATWSGKKNSGAIQDVFLSEIYLGISVIDNENGYLRLEYIFENQDTAIKEIQSLEDDAL